MTATWDGVTINAVRDYSWEVYFRGGNTYTQTFQIEWMRDPGLDCPSTSIDLNTSIPNFTMTRIFGDPSPTIPFSENTDYTFSGLGYSNFYFCGPRAYTFTDQGTSNPITWLSATSNND